LLVLLRLAELCVHGFILKLMLRLSHSLYQPLAAMHSKHGRRGHVGSVRWLLLLGAVSVCGPCNSENTVSRECLHAESVGKRGVLTAQDNLRKTSTAARCDLALHDICGMEQFTPLCDVLTGLPAAALLAFRYQGDSGDLGRFVTAVPESGIR
jgi:hypothetical protein